MAINYTEVGWDTSKYVNPTNMNQMDNGIKAACDGVDTINGGTITGGTIALTSNTVNLGDSLNITLPSGYSSAYQNNKIKLLGSGIAAITFSIKKDDNGVLENPGLGTIAAGHTYKGVLSAAIYDKNNNWTTAPVYIIGNSIQLLGLAPSDVKYLGFGGIVSYT